MGDTRDHIPKPTPSGAAASTELLPQLPVGARRPFRPNRCGSGEKCGLNAVDASTLPALLDTIEVPIRRFTADGAYDHRSVYDQLSAAGTESLVARIGMETEFPLSPSGSVRRCVRTQAVRARSLCSGLFGRVGSP